MSRALVEITGFPELIQRLREVGDDRTKKAALVGVLRKAALGTVRAGRRNAPKSKRPHLISGQRTRKMIQPGNLSRSVGVITGKKGQARTNPTVYVGPRAKGQNDGFYGNFVEYGHNVYREGFRRNRRGTDYARAQNALGATNRTKPVPFMKDSYEQTKGQVTTETEKQVVAYIQKTINRLGRR